MVSKIFERIMDKQTSVYMEKYLSPNLCGYRLLHNCQHPLLVMIERWKKALDGGGFAGGILMDLSKAFDTINHKLLVAKLHAYGFDVASLEIVFDYLSDRWQRTKVGSSFSSWSLILCGMPQGSVLGPKFFNYYINDLFYLFVLTYVCNMADDTTPYACDKSLPDLIRNLESDAASALVWFEANYMIMNPDKCHGLVSGPRALVEHMSFRVGEQVIWESSEERLLGLTIDKELKFRGHLRSICKGASTKVTALTRLARLVPLGRKRLLMGAFVESQFSYCPLLWMFCSKAVNDKINSVHRRALQIVYLDYTSSFEDLLKRDGSVTVHQRNIRFLAIEMFKVVRGLGPETMRTLFSLDYDTRSTRTFFRPCVRTVYNGKDSVRYFGPVVWDDMLPKRFKSIQTLENFKSEIRKWVPVNCLCSLQYVKIMFRGLATLRFLSEWSCFNCL